MENAPLHFKYAPNLNTLFNIPAPSDSNVRIATSFSEETFIEDILKMFYFSKDLKSYIFMGLLGGVLKLYDNILDWNIPVTNYIHEWLKAFIIIFTTIAFLFDLNAVYGLLCFQIFNFNSKIHGIDTDFFHMGMIMVCFVSFVNFLINKITLRNFMELAIFAFMGYCESLLFSEEVSDSKFLVRFFVVLGGIVLVLLDLTGILKIFSKNIVQIMVLGIFYILMDLGMIVGTYFYDSGYLKEIMKKDKSKDNVDMDKESDKSELNVDSNLPTLSPERSPFSPSFQTISSGEKLKEKHRRKQTELKKLKKKQKQKLEKKKQRNKKDVDVRELRGIHKDKDSC